MPFDLDEDDNRREFVRVDDLLPFSWRRVSEEEMGDILRYFNKYRTFPLRQSSSVNRLLSSLDVSEKLRLVERTDPMLAKVLGQIDVKLNLLIRLFHPEQEERPLTPTPVNLGGGGLAFWETKPELQKGDAIEMRVALSADALASVECLGRVMRVAPPETPGGPSRVSCRFEPIVDTDRERLIQHIFKRQGELLRAQKG